MGKHFGKIKLRFSAATEAALNTTVTFLLLKNCYVNASNIIMKQIICIPIRIDSVPFWANLFL